VPATATIKLTVFAGGATFEGGLTELVLDPGDLSELGEYTYKMYIAPSASAMCHRYGVYDGTKKIGEK
jgi:hypothetical protein